MFFLATAVPMGTNPIDTQGSIANLWSFVSSPLGILLALGLGLLVLRACYRLIKRPIRKVAPSRTIDLSSAQYIRAEWRQ